MDIYQYRSWILHLINCYHLAEVTMNYVRQEQTFMEINYEEAQQLIALIERQELKERNEYGVH